jgi:hypothetical protein
VHFDGKIVRSIRLGQTDFELTEGQAMVVAGARRWSSATEALRPALKERLDIGGAEGIAIVVVDGDRRTFGSRPRSHDGANLATFITRSVEPRSYLAV